MPIRPAVAAAAVLAAATALPAFAPQALAQPSKPAPPAAPAPRVPVSSAGPNGAKFFAHPQATQAGVGTVMIDGKTFNHQVALRTQSGEVERHRDWNDTILIIGGRGTEWLGGSPAGFRQTADGEWRGGTNKGAAPQMFGPGDVLFIPAGTLHRMELGKGEKAIRYFTFKSRA